MRARYSHLRSTHGISFRPKAFEFCVFLRRRIRRGTALLCSAVASQAGCESSVFQGQRSGVRRQNSETGRYLPLTL